SVPTSWSSRRRPQKTKQVVDGRSGPVSIATGDIRQSGDKVSELRQSARVGSKFQARTAGGSRNAQRQNTIPNVLCSEVIGTGRACSGVEDEHGDPVDVA